jgi:hypothetical protein
MATRDSEFLKHVRRGDHAHNLSRMSKTARPDALQSTLDIHTKDVTAGTERSQMGSRRSALSAPNIRKSMVRDDD